MNARPLTVTTVADARAGLSGVLRSFRADPAGAPPVVLGSHRKAEAVIMPYARFEQILLAAAGLADERETEREQGTRGQVGSDGPRVAGEAAKAIADAATTADPAGMVDVAATADPVPPFDPVEHTEQIERWLRGLDVTLATASEIVDRGRDAFREDAALPLACEALTTRVGELARLLVAADPQRFDDPMWSLVARSQEIVVQHYSRVDEQMMWVTVAEGFPEIEDLVQGAREG
ncbi:hypothetical protein ASC66_06865 [Leifsonia sp. Root4]|uniref:hypothetical protein n=1 Tax=Leifsonia sp. Root4 TaxID=1736525 RepID=UPI0006F6EE79|nr:hypothetical protein [Leifsonia sp. Root4]KQW06244.1 hypothetical protein ASC66_06865 [Leifsonia sp. Root4]